LRERLLSFYSHLKTEEHMSKLYERNQELADRTAGVTNDDDDETENTLDIPENSGNLVDDILNGAYEEGTGHPQADDLLDDVEHHEFSELEHLN
jgi:hypothetical protein